MLGELKVKIANDLMSAAACIIEGPNDISVEYIMEALKAEGVGTGIIPAKVEELAAKETYESWSVVAEGKKPGETIPGYYEYFFETETNDSKTWIDENGKIRYGKNRVMANAGTKLATYHRSKSGAFGYTVLSSVIAPKPVMDITIECGEGVEVKDDEYFATLGGEIIFENNKLSINNVLVIDGDAKYGVDTETNFAGNVHIKGDVLSGVSIIAGGNVEIDGTVEAAIINSAKDIIIHGGIKGDQKAEILAAGNITCPFVENASIIADGDISVDYVLNSSLKSGDSILISGQRGQMVGGQAMAINSITVDVVGNENGAGGKLEISNPSPKATEHSKIVINKEASASSIITINNEKYRGEVIANREYHLSGGELKPWTIGNFVPVREIEEERPVLTKRKKILLVDDEPIILKTFFGFLAEKYDVLLANSAKDAQSLLEHKGIIPDLILLDYNMPGMTGAEFLQMIRKSTWKTYSNVPVIFVTALSDKKTIVECLTLYPQGYLVKPLGQTELLKAVDDYFASETVGEAS